MERKPWNWSDAACSYMFCVLSGRLWYATAFVLNSKCWSLFLLCSREGRKRRFGDSCLLYTAICTSVALYVIFRVSVAKVCQPTVEIPRPADGFNTRGIEWSLLILKCPVNVAWSIPALPSTLEGETRLEIRTGMQCGSLEDERFVHSKLGTFVVIISTSQENTA